jgi:hypothetical protein
MPDDVLKKLPNFDKTNFGTAKVSLSLVLATDIIKV